MLNFCYFYYFSSAPRVIVLTILVSFLFLIQRENWFILGEIICVFGGIGGTRGKSTEPGKKVYDMNFGGANKN